MADPTGSPPLHGTSFTMSNHQMPTGPWARPSLQAAARAPLKTTLLPITIHLKGTYALKGISGNADLAGIMPQEVAAAQRIAVPKRSIHLIRSEYMSCWLRGKALAC